jgi:hypothetical protein
MRIPLVNPGLAALLAGAVSTGHAQEIAPWRLTGVEGYVGIRAINDDLATTSNGVRSRQAQSDLREELFVMTHSYVYHPNLATLDLGAGPVFQQGRFSTDSSDTRSDATLYNFTARATLLRDKPYQGAVYVEHLNPALSIAPGQILIQENEQYGMSFALLAPATPVPLRMDASHGHFHGSSTDRRIDDQVDRFSLRANRSFGQLGSTQFLFQSTEQDSQSGNPNLPIQHSSSQFQGTSLDSHFQLGDRRQYDLVNLVSVNTQSYLLEQGPLPDRRDVHFLLDGRARHSEQLQTFALYNYSSSVQGNLSSFSRSASAGASYWITPDLSLAGGARLENTDATEVETRVRGVDASVRYFTPLAQGELQTSYTTRLENRDQISTAPTGTVIGERVVMSGITFVTLAHQHALASSVVVSNITRTQTYMEGVDYTVTVVGADTRLQRVVGGSILDGQTVLVDYQYAAGGTFSYRQQDQTLSVNWSYRSMLNAYFRHLESVPTLSSGLPTFPLNEVHSDLVGVRADVPLRGLRLVEMASGGFVEHESRRETISPFERAAQEAYLQSEEPMTGGNVRFGVRHTRVQYHTASPGVDLHAFDVRFTSRRLWGLDLSADYTHETDTGGPVPRRREAASLRSLWAYRKVRVTFEMGHTTEEQGGVERRHFGGRLTMRRDF